MLYIALDIVLGILVEVYKMKNLILRLSKKEDYSDILDLKFDLVPSVFLPKWIDRYLEASQRQDPISEPWAFYNLNNDWTEQKTIDFLNYHIDVCNSIVPNLFNKKLDDISDQDTLNYIHSVFELHHGKLDEWLDNPLFKSNPKQLRESLSHINQTVHRCESFNGKKYMRIVYFDLPKNNTFSNDDYKLFTNYYEFGGLYTLYADVGKNLESLAFDNDQHHHDFVPNLHYSVDCVLKLTEYQTDVEKIKKYYYDNIEYFNNLGYKENDIRLTTGNIKIAQLQYTNQQEILEQISNYNHIQKMIVF